MIRVNFTPRSYQDILAYIQKTKTEQVVFLFLAPTAESQTTSYDVVDYYLVPSHELIFESQYHAELTEEAQAKVIKMAWDKQLILGEIHSHPGSYEGTTFSPSDLNGFKDFVPHIWWRLKGKPYVAFVFGKGEFDSLVWLSNPHDPSDVAEILTEGKPHVPTGNTLRRIEEERERERIRYSRQAEFFGEVGQQKIREKRVAIVGL